MDSCQSKKSVEKKNGLEHRYMNILRKVEDKLRELDVPFIAVEKSPIKGKKVRVWLREAGAIEHVDFGSATSTTFLERPDEKKREAYRARHSKIFLKDGTRAIDNKYSPAWFSWKVLW